MINQNAPGATMDSATLPPTGESIPAHEAQATRWVLQTAISEAGRRSYFFNLRVESVGGNRFTPRTEVLVTYTDAAGESVESNGTIQPSGVLSGMARLFRHLKLDVGDQVTLDCQVSSAGVQTARIASVTERDRPYEEQPTVQEPARDDRQTVLAKWKARYVHFDAYRPELWNDWEPSGESDVYLAFGALQEYTDFIYCCGVNKQILRELSILKAYDERKVQKAAEGLDEGIPDALFIDRTTREYLVAEFKIRASQFAMNHSPDLVDVLVCWIDDEPDKSKLPARIVILKDKARDAGLEAFGQ
jgi:hypothetical protein